MPNPAESRLDWFVRQCSEQWRTVGGEEGFRSPGSDDVRVYQSGGMWLHPCGATFQAGGRDGFRKDCGDFYCPCDLCSAMRAELRYRLEHPQTFGEA